MKNNNLGDVSVTMQIFGFFIIILMLLIVYKYYVSTYEDPVSSNPINESTTANIQPVINTVRCPPKEFKMYKHDDNPLEHKNKLNNPSAQIQLYKEGDEISAEGFQKSVYTPVSQDFADELEEVYTQSMATPHMVNYVPNAKPNKSDLPIANVPYFLLQDDQPLRLSEKPM